MDEGEITVDFIELQNQRKEEIIRSGEYCLAEVVIGRKEKMPIAHVEIKNITSEELGFLMCTLREVILKIGQADPAALEIYKRAKLDVSKTIIKNADNDEELRKQK